MSDHDRTGETWEFDSGLRVLVLTTTQESMGFGWNHLVVILDSGRDRERRGAEGKTLYMVESVVRKWGTWPHTEKLLQKV